MTWAKKGEKWNHWENVGLCRCPRSASVSAEPCPGPLPAPSTQPFQGDRILKTRLGVIHGVITERVMAIVSQALLTIAIIRVFSSSISIAKVVSLGLLMNDAAGGLFINQSIPSGWKSAVISFSLWVNLNKFSCIPRWGITAFTVTVATYTKCEK